MICLRCKSLYWALTEIVHVYVVVFGVFLGIRLFVVRRLSLLLLLFLFPPFNSLNLMFGFSFGFIC